MIAKQLYSLVEPTCQSPRALNWHAVPI